MFFSFDVHLFVCNMLETYVCCCFIVCEYLDVLFLVFSFVLIFAYNHVLIVLQATQC